MKKEDDPHINSFAKYFKGYMGSAPIFAAALPIPVTSLNIIPTFSDQTGYLTTYTSMFCFLVVAMIFYRRHRLGSYLAPDSWDKKSRLIGRFIISWLPFVLAILTLISIIIYHLTFNDIVAVHLSALEVKGDAEKIILDSISTHGLGFMTQGIIILSYFGIFIFSTAAFTLMAVREYMQNVLGLSETEMVKRASDPFVDKE